MGIHASLRQTDFSEFCTVNDDLKHTAAVGYDRVVTLASSMPESRIVKETAVLVDVKRCGKDERYHEALFRALASGLCPNQLFLTIP